MLGERKNEVEIGIGRG